MASIALATAQSTKRKRSVPDVTPQTGMGRAMQFSMSMPLAADTAPNVDKDMTEKTATSSAAGARPMKAWRLRKVAAVGIPSLGGWRAKDLDMQVLRLADRLVSERKLCDDLRAQASLAQERLEKDIARVEAEHSCSITDAQLRVEQSKAEHEESMAKLANVTAELERLTLAHRELEARQVDALQVCDRRRFETKTLQARVSEMRDKMSREEADRETRERELSSLMRALLGMSRDMVHLESFKPQLSSYMKGRGMGDEDLEIIDQIMKAKEEGWQKEKQLVDEMKTMEEKLKTEHSTRQTDMQARFEAGNVEINELRQRNELHQHRDAVEQATILRREKDAALDNLRDLQARHAELVASLSQLIVVCVDLSDSLTSVVYKVFDIYRHILTRVQSRNSTASVAVIVHGLQTPRDLPGRAVSEDMISFLDSSRDESSPSVEDYNFCLRKAQAIVAASNAIRKVVILIGDGCAECRSGEDLSVAREACDGLMRSKVPVHSIIVSWGQPVRRSPRLAAAQNTTQAFAEQTDGQVHVGDGYQDAVDKMLGY